jgi:radial spoke head protein 1
MYFFSLYFQRHGQGVFVSEEGGYEGAWDNDTQHGYGKMVCSSEDSYDGHWVKGQRHGLGIMSYTSGSFLRYEGEWQYHQQTGKGNLDFRNGSRYEGMFKAGKFHGLGILTYANGIRIEGKWAAGVFEGKMQVGKGKGRDPVVIFAGTWKDGIVVHEKTQFDLPPRQPLFNLFAKD